MSYDPEQRRRALHRFLAMRAERGQPLSVLAWTKRARLSESGVRNFLAGRSRTLTDETYELLAQAAGVTAATLRGEAAEPVALAGYVGAGDVIDIIPDDERTAIDWTPAPPGLHAGEAVQVRGDSMWPAYRDGDLLFYERVPRATPGERLRWSAVIDRDAVLEAADGRRWCKRVRTGREPGLFDLYSYNREDVIRDVEIVVAAPVRWIWRP